MGNAEILNIALISAAGFLIYTSLHGTIMYEKTMFDAVRPSPIYINPLYLFIIVYMIVFVLGLNSPMVVRLISVKGSLILGAATIGAFIGSSLVPSGWLLYLISVITGIGLSLYLTATNYLLYFNADSSLPKFISHVRCYTFITQVSFFAASLLAFITIKITEEITVIAAMVISLVLTITPVIAAVLIIFLKIPLWTPDEWSNYYTTSVVSRILQLLFNMWVAVQFAFASHFFLGYVKGYFTSVWFICVGASLPLEDPKLKATEAGMFFGIGVLAGSLLFGLLGKYTSDKIGRYLVAWLMILIILPLGVFLNDVIHPMTAYGDSGEVTFWGPTYSTVVIYSVLFGFIEGSMTSLLQVSLIEAFGESVTDYVPVYLASVSYQFAGGALCFLISTLTNKVNTILVPLFAALGLLLYGIFDLSFVLKKRRETAAAATATLGTPT